MAEWANLDTPTALDKGLNLPLELKEMSKKKVSYSDEAPDNVVEGDVMQNVYIKAVEVLGEEYGVDREYFREMNTESDLPPWFMSAKQDTGEPRTVVIPIGRVPELNTYYTRTRNHIDIPDDITQKNHDFRAGNINAVPDGDFKLQSSRQKFAPKLTDGTY
jgi:hypothetical protein